jgi:Membrane domain of glycerophosphoryl diester phosphodiesterase
MLAEKWGRFMSNTTMPASRSADGEFRVGRVFDRTTAVYTRNFVPFSLVTLIASAPPLLLLAGGMLKTGASAGFGASMYGRGFLMIALYVVISIVLSLLSQAILVYASFQDMSGKPVNLNDSFNIALSRFLPIIGLTILMGFGLWIGFMLLIIPGVILMVRWFVSVPVCVVERLGSWECLKRSAQLTKGHRWKVFGIILLLYLGAGIINQIITYTLTAVGGSMLGLFGTLIWNTVWGAFFAIFVVVTYFELRVAKEGVNIEQIVSVFD